MTGPINVFQRCASVSSRLISDAADILRDAADKMDGAPNLSGYTSADLVDTASELGQLAVRGGRELAESVRGAFADPDTTNPQVSAAIGPALIADQLSTIVERTVGQYGRICHQAADDMRAGRPDTWMPMFTRLLDVTVVNGIEAVQTAVIGPAPFARTTFRSDPVDVTPAARDRALTVVRGFARAGSDAPIRPIRARLDPAVLPANATQFTVIVDEENLPSGIYLGAVDVGGDETVTVTLRM